MAQEQDLRLAATELGEQMIAALGTRQAGDASADCFET